MSLTHKTAGNTGQHSCLAMPFTNERVKNMYLQHSPQLCSFQHTIPHLLTLQHVMKSQNYFLPEAGDLYLGLDHSGTVFKSAHYWGSNHCLWHNTPGFVAAQSWGHLKSRSENMVNLKFFFDSSAKLAHIPCQQEVGLNVLTGREKVLRLQRSRMTVFILWIATCMKKTILFFLSYVLSGEHSLLLLSTLSIPAGSDLSTPISGSTRLCLNHTCLLTKSSKCLQCHKHPPQFKLCTTDELEVIWVLHTTQCLISCIISHTHHYVSELSPAQNQNSSKRNPGKQGWPKQIWTSITLHVLGEDHEEKVCHTSMWKLNKICSMKNPTVVSQHMLGIHFISAKQADFADVFSWHFSYSRCKKSLQRKVSFFCYSGHQHENIFPLLFWILLKVFNASK